MTNIIDTAAIELLRDFAARHTNVWCPAPVAHMTAFVQLCNAALRGEAWAIARVNVVLDGLGARVRDCGPLSTDEFDDERLRAILATDARCPADEPIGPDDDDDHPDFSIVEVMPVYRGDGSDVPSHYRVVARLFGPIAHLVSTNPVDDSRKTWGGLLTTWLGLYTPDGAGCALTSDGWESADQWINATVDRELGTAAAVELGKRILAAAVVP